MPDTKQPVIDWEPTPGFVLCKPVKREELAELYGKAGGPRLSLPDNVGKVSDAVGVGQVIRVGGYTQSDQLEAVTLAKRMGAKVYNELSQGDKDKKVFAPHISSQVKVGDYIAWMPYTDLIIEIDGLKYSLVGYEKIRAVRKGQA